MDEPTRLLIFYLVAGPLGALALYFALRWALHRFPTRTRRDMDELKRRLATIEEIVTHLAKQEKG